MRSEYDKITRLGPKVRRVASVMSSNYFEFALTLSVPFMFDTACYICNSSAKSKKQIMNRLNAKLTIQITQNDSSSNKYDR